MKYTFVVECPVSFGIEVEANTLAEAVVKAKESHAIVAATEKTSPIVGIWYADIDGLDLCDADLVDLHADDSEDSYDDARDAWEESPGFV